MVYMAGCCIGISHYSRRGGCSIHTGQLDGLEMSSDKAPMAWCEVDECPSYICGAVHREIRTDLGVEYLAPDQEPIGKVLEDQDQDG